MYKFFVSILTVYKDYKKTIIIINIIILYLYGIDIILYDNANIVIEYKDFIVSLYDKICIFLDIDKISNFQLISSDVSSLKYHIMNSLISLTLIIIILNYIFPDILIGFFGYIYGKTIYGYIKYIGNSDILCNIGPYKIKRRLSNDEKYEIYKEMCEKYNTTPDIDFYNNTFKSDLENINTFKEIKVITDDVDKYTTETPVIIQNDESNILYKSMSYIWDGISETTHTVFTFASNHPMLIIGGVFVMGLAVWGAGSVFSGMVDTINNNSESIENFKKISKANDSIVKTHNEAITTISTNATNANKCITSNAVHSDLNKENITKLREECEAINNLGKINGNFIGEVNVKIDAVKELLITFLKVALEDDEHLVFILDKIEASFNSDDLSSDNTDSLLTDSQNFDQALNIRLENLKS